MTSTSQSAGGSAEVTDTFPFCQLGVREQLKKMIKMSMSQISVYVYTKHEGSLSVCFSQFIILLY